VAADARILRPTSFAGVEVLEPVASETQKNPQPERLFAFLGLSCNQEFLRAQSFFGAYSEPCTPPWISPVLRRRRVVGRNARFKVGVVGYGNTMRAPVGPFSKDDSAKARTRNE